MKDIPIVVSGSSHLNLKPDEYIDLFVAALSPEADGRLHSAPVASYPRLDIATSRSSSASMTTVLMSDNTTNGEYNPFKLSGSLTNHSNTPSLASHSKTVSLIEISGFLERPDSERPLELTMLTGGVWTRFGRHHINVSGQSLQNRSFEN